MAYAPTVQAEAGFPANSVRHYGEVLGELRTDNLSHADVNAGCRPRSRSLRRRTGARRRGQTSTSTSRRRRPWRPSTSARMFDLNDADLGDEPVILGATDCSFFTGPGGEQFMVATSLVGSCTFPSYLRAMRRADLADDPRFGSAAAARKAHFAELHHIVQTWILTFRDVGSLDAQLHEAKIALGEVRSLRSSPRRSGRSIGARSKKSRTATAELTVCRAARGASPAINSSRSRTLPFRGEHNRAVFSKLGLARWAVPRDRF